MSRKLELLDAYLKGWNSENQKYVIEYESNEFLRGTMFAIDRIRLQIQKQLNTKKNDNRRKS
jgi:hypothetical protein